jgi:hypothetical protein
MTRALGLATIRRYLIGDRAAILALGADRDTPFVGVLLVLSAGLARSYHTADFLAQPWRLLAPFAVSTVMATVLLMTTLIGPRKVSADDHPRKTGFLRGRFLPFLGLFWMTAPLAWLYGIPYGRFADPLTATEAKVWTLGVVSVWRVLLMTRVLSVLSGRSAVATFFHVMLVADGVVAIALSAVKAPLIQFMGEIPLTASEHFLADTVLLTRIAAVLSFPVWLIGAGIAFFRPRKWSLALPMERSASKEVWFVAVASVVLGMIGLLWTQPELRLATRAESLLRDGYIEEALALMSGRRPGDFPPHWEPPPRVGYGEESPPLLDVIEAIVRTPAADWVRQAYLSSFERRFLRGHDDAIDPQAWSRAMRLFDLLPEGKSLREEYKEQIRYKDQYFEERRRSP